MVLTLIAIIPSPSSVNDPEVLRPVWEKLVPPHPKYLAVLIWSAKEPLKFGQQGRAVFLNPSLRGCDAVVQTHVHHAADNTKAVFFEPIIFVEYNIRIIVHPGEEWFLIRIVFSAGPVVELKIYDIFHTV